MIFAYVSALLLIIVCSVLVFLTSGRRKRPEFMRFFGLLAAHRGLHSEGIPENSIPAFKKAAENEFGIELDVHLSADGVAVVHHDFDLFRMTGEHGMIPELTAEVICSRRLLGTEYRVPKFSEVLEAVGGRVPLIVELKCDPKKDASALCQTVSEMMDEYKAKYPSGIYCVESFNPFIVKWYRENRPDVFRGQLSEQFYKKKTNRSVVGIIMEYLLVNVLGRPDFVAYNCKHTGSIILRVWRKIYGAPVALWTIKSQKELDRLVSDGWDSCAYIFEGFIPDKKIR